MTVELLIYNCNRLLETKVQLQLFDDFILADVADTSQLRTEELPVVPASRQCPPLPAPSGSWAATLAVPGQHVAAARNHRA